MNILPFKKKEKLGIVKHGNVIIQPDGTVLIENFVFSGVDIETSMELARSWALRKLRNA